MSLCLNIPFCQKEKELFGTLRNHAEPCGTFRSFYLSCGITFAHRKPTGKIPTGITKNIFNNMGIAVKVSKRTLNFRDTKTEMYVASADRGDVINTKKLAEYVAQDTGSRPAQVRMILTTVINSMVGWLEEGHGVNLEGFGTFLPAVKSQSSTDKEKVGVKRIRISFFPCKELSAKARAMNYSIEDDSATSASDESTGGDEETGNEGSDGGATGGNPL